MTIMRTTVGSARTILLIGVAAVSFLTLFRQSILIVPQQQELNGNQPQAAAIAVPQEFNRNQPQAAALNRRKFIRYESSSWEAEWLSVIGSFNSQNIRFPICEKLHVDVLRVRRYLNATCNRFSSSESDWCVIEDTYRPIYFNRQTGLAQQNPPDGKLVESFNQIQPLVIQDENADIFSRFVYFNEATNQTYYEYIEPLIAFLRHPLSCCEDYYNFSANFAPRPGRSKAGCFGYLRTSRTQYIPPSPTMKREGGTFSDAARYLYFDAGASDWSAGSGGPSLKYFYEMYKVHGISFDKMYCYEAQTTVAEFNATLPQEHKNMVEYQQVYVRSQAAEDSSTKGPFLPHLIQQIAKKEDYVLFKLDIDSPGVEEGNIDYLLDPQNEILDYIDEFFYEFHLERKAKRKMSDWYKIFLTFRNKGVRAHSWI